MNNTPTSLTLAFTVYFYRIKAGVSRNLRITRVHPLRSQSKKYFSESYITCMSARREAKGAGRTRGLGAILREILNLDSR